MKKLFTVLVVVFMALSLSACSNKDTGSDNEESAGAVSIKLGGSGPLTGGAAEYGKAVQNAAQLAVDEVNELEGYKFFDFNMQDDEHDTEKALNAFGVLMDWGMQLSLNTVTSGPGIAVAQSYKDANIFALTPSGSNPSVTLLGDGSDPTQYYGNIFQMCFTDPNQGKASADYFALNNLGSKVAVLYQDDIDYSTSIRATFIEEAKVKNLDVVYEGTFQAETQDFSTLLTQAQAAGADVLFLPIYYQPASLILDQAKKMNYAPIFFGVDGMDGILSQEGFDQSLANGVYLLTPFSATADDEKTQHFVSAYKELYDGVTPNQFAADAYDCVYLLYNLCKENGLTGANSAEEICSTLVNAITSTTFSGITGTSKWEANGQVTKDPMAVIIQDGVYVDAK